MTSQPGPPGPPDTRSSDRPNAASTARVLVGAVADEGQHAVTGWVPKGLAQVTRDVLQLRGSAPVIRISTSRRLGSRAARLCRSVRRRDRRPGRIRPCRRRVGATTAHRPGPRRPHHRRSHARKLAAAEPPGKSRPDTAASQADLTVAWPGITPGCCASTDCRGLPPTATGRSTTDRPALTRSGRLGWSVAAAAFDSRQTARRGTPGYCRVPRDTVVVANGGEGEPASIKTVVLHNRPHLVLDGGAAAGRSDHRRRARTVCVSTTRSQRTGIEAPSRDRQRTD